MKTPTKTVTNKQAKAKAIKDANDVVAAKAAKLRQAGQKVHDSQAVAKANVNRTTHANVTIERLSPALAELETIVGDFIDHAANTTHGLVPEFFIGYKARITLIIGSATMKESACGIWRSQETGWVTIDGEPTMEIMIPPHVLGLGLPAIVATGIHQIGHLVNNKLQRDDVSKNGRHLELFETTMKQFMVVAEKVPTNVQFKTESLTDLGMKWIERQKFSEATFTVFAEIADKAASTPRKGKAAAANSDKAAAKAKAAKENVAKAAKFDKFAELFAPVGCPTKAHRKATGSVFVELAKLDKDGRTTVNCGIVVKSERCSKSLVTIS